MKMYTKKVLNWLLVTLAILTFATSVHARRHDQGGVLNSISGPSLESLTDAQDLMRHIKAEYGVNIYATDDLLSASDKEIQRQIWILDTYFSEERAAEPGEATLFACNELACGGGGNPSCEPPACRSHDQIITTTSKPVSKD